MISQFQLQYQIAPIILTRGAYGNGMSIISLLGGIPSSFDNTFAKFQPLPGATLIEQTIGQYPFANQSVAGNAIIRQPLALSLVMITPQAQNNSWSLKLSTMTSLKATLDNHNNAGGTYTVMTPSYTFIDMVMIALVDMSTGETVLAQNAWRWDFHKPLISLQDAASAQNSLMSKVTSGLPTGKDGLNSTGAGATVGGASLLNPSLTTPVFYTETPLGYGGIGTDSRASAVNVPVSNSAPGYKG